MNWTELEAAGDIPDRRQQHTMTVLADGTAVIFGGYGWLYANGWSHASYDDVYTLSVSGTNASWTSLTSQGGTPDLRDDHSMTALADDTLVLFGGSGLSSYLDDVC